ncbi:MAG: ABC transporter ATP-binding protein [Deltaproteobacteria bacterium]|nr:ABC transporter ATP-binding protein [Deltaproteobacteria bacterium]
MDKSNTKHSYSYYYIIKWIYNRLKKVRKKQFWFIFLCMFCVAIFETITLGSVAFFASAITDPVTVLSSKYIIYIKQVIDVKFLNSAKGLIISSGLLMFFFIVLKNILKAIANYWLTLFSIIMEAYFGEILLNGFLKLPYQWHLSRNTADLVNAVQWRTFLGRNFFQPFLTILNDVLMVIIMLTLLMIVQPVNLILIVVLLGGSAYFVYSVIRNLIDKTSTIASNYEIKMNKEVTMFIHGIKDVKISQKENASVLKFNESAIPLAKVSAARKFYGDCPVFIMESVGFGILLLSTCIMLLKFNSTTAYVTGSMALLAVTAWRIFPAVSKILGSSTAMRGALPYIKTVIDYLSFVENDEDIAFEIEENNINSFKYSKSIIFNNVSFSYKGSDKKVIKNIKFEIKKGETVGVIGTSGSGKSTIVDLLIGLLKPVGGEILIDDHILKNKLMFKWLNSIGYVSQSPYIFDGTIAQNVSFEMEYDSIDREMVRQCCSMAAMDDFLYDQKDNIDSFIGERGVKLSGGQQQRIAIARALYNKPEIMVFDEATSSLDSKSEQLIQDTIYSFKGKQTLIIVAHRLSTVKDCDKIIWVDKGKIKLHGKASNVLMEYKQMMNLQ